MGDKLSYKPGKEAYAHSIREWIHLIDEYDMEPLIKVINKNVIRYHLHIYADHGKVVDTNITYDERATDQATLVSEVRRQVIDKYGSLERLKEKQATSALFTHYYFRPATQGKKHSDNKYSLRDNGESMLFFVLDYVINGNLEEDYGRANTMLDKLKRNDGFMRTIRMGEWNKVPELNNIEIKWYANGNVEIKGLTEDHKAKLEDLEKLSRL